MNADLVVQTAIRARLVATAAVTELVPATSILDTHGTPAPRPSIILGDAQVVDTETAYARNHWRVFHTLHIWKKEPSREGAKTIAAAVAAALTPGRLVLTEGYHCADCRVSSVRAMSDPDGETAHAVVVVEALVEGPA